MREITQYIVSKQQQMAKSKESMSLIAIYNLKVHLMSLLMLNFI